MTGTIPKSDALAEATESISELMSRDPMSYGQQDLDRVIDSMRSQREAWERAEAAGVKPKAQRIPTTTRVTQKSVDDVM